jgi:hypothetical protein
MGTYDEPYKNMNMGKDTGMCFYLCMDMYSRLWLEVGGSLWQFRDGY